MKKQPKIEVFQANAGPDGFWYWRLVAANGETVADGAEGYAKRGNALRAARRAQKLMAQAVIA